MAEENYNVSPGLFITMAVFASIGVLKVAILVLECLLNIISALRVFCFAKFASKSRFRKYGKWAVVTGSTDGIGKEYARQLAESGLNIVLISRTQEKLEAVAAKIRSDFGVETEVVQADFSQGRPIYDNIAQQVRDKDVGVLVNNVGVAVTPVGKFCECSEDKMWAQVNVNVASVPAMTKLILPGMVTRRRGLIINIASLAASVPMPSFQIYSATKAFVDYFSQAVGYEYESSGVTVQAVLPGAVSTALLNSVGYELKGLMAPPPAKFVRSALSTVGYTTRTAGYWPHAIQLWMSTVVPKSMVMSFTMRNAQGNR